MWIYHGRVIVVRTMEHAYNVSTKRLATIVNTAKMDFMETPSNRIVVNVIAMCLVQMVTSNTVTAQRVNAHV